MVSIIEQSERRQMQKLRAELADRLTPDLNTDINIYRWIHGWRGDIAEASRRFRTYIENRSLAGLDGENFLEEFYSHPTVLKFSPYFMFTVTPNVVNPIDNTVIILQRFYGVDYHQLTKVITAGQFLNFYFAVCEWELRQVLKQENESGRKSGLTIVFDLDNFNLLSYVNPNSAIMKIFGLCLRLLQDYFCDLLHRLLIINAPPVLNVVLAVVKNFLNPVTQQKFMVVSKKEDLFKYVCPSVLPVRYGGTRRLTQADLLLGGDTWKKDNDTCTLVPRSVTQLDFFVPKKFPHKPTNCRIQSKGELHVRKTVDRVGAKLVWQFTVSSEVQFTVVRVMQDGRKIPCIPCWAVITPQLPEEGALLCTETGEYALQFTNMNDGWFPLKVEYYFEVEYPKEVRHG